ncbi:MAG: PHB depolymerase family esterase [Phycisphaerales bacterium]
MQQFFLLLVVAVQALCFAGCAMERTKSHHETGLLYRSVDVDGVERRYAVYLPREYRATDKWPCIVFLNGSGECGEDGQRQLTQGLFPAMINAPTDWPFVAIFPQKLTRASTWLDHDAYVMATLAKTQQECSIDASRIYLTGLSQGGAGTWAIGAKHANVFAAIAPVCGFGDADSVGPALRDMPIWAMHGEKDDVVPIVQSEKLINAAAHGRPIDLNPQSGSSLKPDTKSPLRFSRFPDLNHGCWDRAYRDMELGEWLLSFRKQRVGLCGTFRLNSPQRREEHKEKQ